MAPVLLRLSCPKCRRQFEKELREELPRHAVLSPCCRVRIILCAEGEVSHRGPKPEFAEETEAT